MTRGDNENIDFLAKMAVAISSRYVILPVKRNTRIPRYPIFYQDSSIIEKIEFSHKIIISMYNIIDFHYVCNNKITNESADRISYQLAGTNRILIKYYN